MARLKITQITVHDRRQAEPARHAALARPQAHRRRRRQGGPPRDPRHGHARSRTWSPSRRSTDMARTTDRSEASTTCVPPPAPRPPRPAWVAARLQGQDRRSRHQGHQGPLPGVRRLRGRADAAAHAAARSCKGFKNPFRVEYQVVNLDKLGELFPDGGEVTVDDLVAKGAVRKAAVKVLGTGDISVALQVSAHAFSAQRQGQDRRCRRHRHRAVRRHRTRRRRS